MCGGQNSTVEENHAQSLGQQSVLRVIVMMRISSQTVNRVVAISAILISAASFYVAVLQTKASQQQVKAETWPYLQIDNSNYDSEAGESIISYTLVNAGVGPARVVSMQLFYREHPVGGFFQLAQYCCVEGMEVSDQAALFRSEAIGTVITANPAPIILPSEAEVDLFRLYPNTENQEFWGRINRARNELRAVACYCSVLDECWNTNFIDDPEPVKNCSTDPDAQYRG